jgi:3-phosphoshikimate 1-carboxyvinyltransferase
MLASLGASIESDDTTVSLSPILSLSPLDLTVPGDPSSAAYFVAYAVLGGGEVTIPGVCINPTRSGFVDTLTEMGARVFCEDRVAAAGDSVATIVARKSSLTDFTVTAQRIPSMIDELPLLACVAAHARVRLEVRGAQELRVKESDRIAVVAGNLRALGADVEELNDGFIVHGRSGPLAGRIVTEGDHRIAMAFGVLAALPGNSIEIDDPACVSVSYPEFWNDLESLHR